MANMPTSLPSFTNPGSTDYLSSPAHSTQHSTLNDEVAAIAAKVGADSSAVATSLDYKVSSASSNNPGHKHIEDWVTASDGATVTFNLSSGSKQKVTLGDNRTLALSNVVAGHCFILRLIQDATGSRTVTWFSTIKWPAGVAPTLTTTANKEDVFGFFQTSTDNYQGFIIGQNL